MRGTHATHRRNHDFPRETTELKEKRKKASEKEKRKTNQKEKSLGMSRKKNVMV